MSGAGEQGTRLDIELRGSGVALIDPTFFTNFGGQPAGDYRTSYRLTGSLQKTPGELTLILGSWDPRFTSVPQPGAPPELFDLLPPLAGTFPVNRFETAFGPGGGGVTLTQDWAIALVSLDDNAVLRARFFETGEGAFVVPEPTTLLLWSITMAGLGLAAQWRQRRKN